MENAVDVSLLLQHHAELFHTADAAELLLAAGAAGHADTRNAQGDTLLLLATKLQSTDLVHTLVAAGAAVDRADRDAKTPLMIAATQGNIACFDVLLAGGADVLRVDAMGRTALSYAVQHGWLDAIDVLLAAGANIESVDNSGRSVVHFAVLSQSIRVLEKVIYVDAATVVMDTGHAIASPLMVAAQVDNARAVHVLLSAGADANFVCDHGTTALVFACYDNTTDAVVQLLLAAGADADTTDSDGLSPIQIATSENKLAIVDALLAYGANVNSNHATHMCELPLEVAVVLGHRAIAQSLLAAGASVDANPVQGCTALHTAAQLGDVEQVDMLLVCGANVDHTDDQGFTALMKAVGQGHERVVQRLLAAQANVHATCFEGHTALHFACQGNDNENEDERDVGAVSEDPARISIVHMLLQAGANANSTNTAQQSVLMEACSYSYVSIVSQLLSAGADVAYEDKRGTTALHATIIRGNVLLEKRGDDNDDVYGDDVLDKLLQYGADVNSASIEDLFPLTSAAYRGYDGVVSRLLRAGANVNAADANGMTALMMAVIEGHVSCVAVLLNAGADPTLETTTGHTALFMAQYSNHDAIVEMLEIAEAKELVSRCSAVKPRSLLTTQDATRNELYTRRGLSLRFSTPCADKLDSFLAAQGR